LKKVHAGFLEVGCDVVETDSFGSTFDRAREYATSLTWTTIEREGAHMRSEWPRFFKRQKSRAGRGSRANYKTADLGHISFLDMKASYREQARVCSMVARIC